MIFIFFLIKRLGEAKSNEKSLEDIIESLAEEIDLNSKKYKSELHEKECEIFYRTEENKLLLYNLNNSKLEREENEKVITEKDNLIENLNSGIKKYKKLAEKTINLQKKSDKLDAKYKRKIEEFKKYCEREMDRIQDSTLALDAKYQRFNQLAENSKEILKDFDDVANTDESLFGWNLSSFFYNLHDGKKFRKANYDKIELASKIDYMCTIKSVHTPGKTYQTTARSCTCESFKRDRKPCKHMIYVALLLGFISKKDEDFKKSYNNLSKIVLQLDKERIRLKAVKNPKYEESKEIRFLKDITTTN